MTQSCDICRGDRYQRRGRGDQGQQGTQDWLEAQRRQCKISPQNNYYVTLILLYVSGIEDLHKALPQLFVPEFFSVIAAKASLVSLVGSQGLIVSSSSFVGVSPFRLINLESDLQFWRTIDSKALLHCSCEWLQNCRLIFYALKAKLYYTRG